MKPPKLMAVLAHPDDESLGMGATLAKYAAAGVEIFVVTATRGERGRYRGHARGSAEHPGPAALATMRETELRAAAAVLGVRELTLLDYHDGELDGADPREAASAIARHVRRIRPDVVVTFGPDGAYGHPDHIAISQFATAAHRRCRRCQRSPSTARIRRTRWRSCITLHGRSRRGTAYQAAFKRLTSSVDGVRAPGHGRGPTGRSPPTIDTRDVVVHGVAGGVVSRVAGAGVRAPAGPVARAPRVVVGPAVVLSRVQHGQRRARAARPTCSRDLCEW